MTERNFRQLLDARWAEDKLVCVGLDSEYAKLPQAARRDGYLDTVVGFNDEIVQATCDLVCAYKINTAFYEAHGSKGIQALEETCAHIRDHAPGVPIILDAKRADIGNTNDHYVAFAFDVCKADAITVHPYMGAESLKPFLDCKTKGIFVLCRTSNPGAGEFQGLIQQDVRPLYLNVAVAVATKWNANHNCGLVVGATAPDELARVRRIASDVPLLIPGIGAQGGDLDATIRAGRDFAGRGMIINSSRGIIFASSKDDYAEAARREAQKLHDQIRAILNS